jgi:hypothetical protein
LALHAIYDKLKKKLFYIDKTIFSLNMPNWAMHKDLFSYQVVFVKTEIDPNETWTFWKKKQNVYLVYDTPTSLDGIVLLFILVPFLLLHTYLYKSGWYLRGRPAHFNRIYQFLNFFLRFEVLLSYVDFFDHIYWNAYTSKKRNHNHVNSYTPGRLKFGKPHLAQGQFVGPNYTWGDGAANSAWGFGTSHYVHLHFFFFSYSCFFSLIFYKGLLFCVILLGFYLNKKNTKLAFFCSGFIKNQRKTERSWKFVLFYFKNLKNKLRNF